MGIFSRKRRESRADGARAGSQMDFARRLQAQAMEQAAGWQRAANRPGSVTEAGPVPEAGSMTWARQVMAILAPPGPGFVKRCSCVTCGAPKKLPSVTAYVYCEYCASLADYDLRRATGTPTAPSRSRSTRRTCGMCRWPCPTGPGTTRPTAVLTSSTWPPPRWPAPSTRRPRRWNPR